MKVKVTHIGLGIKAGQGQIASEILLRSPYQGSKRNEASRGEVFRPPAAKQPLLPIEFVDVGPGGLHENLRWSISKDGTLTVGVTDPEEVGCGLHILGFGNEEPGLYYLGKNRIQLEQSATPAQFHVGIDFENFGAIRDFQSDAFLRAPANKRFHDAVALKKRERGAGAKSGDFFVKILDGFGVEFTFGPHGLGDHFPERSRGNPPANVLGSSYDIGRPYHGK